MKQIALTNCKVGYRSSHSNVLNRQLTKLVISETPFLKNVKRFENYFYSAVVQKLDLFFRLMNEDKSCYALSNES